MAVTNATTIIATIVPRFVHLNRVSDSSTSTSGSSRPQTKDSGFSSSSAVLSSMDSAAGVVRKAGCSRFALTAKTGLKIDQLAKS